MPKRWTSFCNYVWSWESYIVLRQPCISHVVMVKCGLCQCSRVFARLGFFRYSEFINMNLYEGWAGFGLICVYRKIFSRGGNQPTPLILATIPVLIPIPGFDTHTHIPPQNKHNKKSWGISLLFFPILVHNYIVVIGSSVCIPQITPFFDPVGCKTDSPATETIWAPSIEIHEVTAHGIEVVHIVGFKTPGRTETVG